ncbi:MAG: T9SS type A sorting domain-containing protein [Chitinophagales bacterium]
MKKCIVFILLINAFLINANAQTEMVWNTFVDSVSNFASPRAADLTGDGVLDIVTGGGLEDNARQYGVTAFDGETGDILWQVSSRNQMYGSVRFMDITGDGISEVFATGRAAKLIAIDGVSGDIVWEFYPQGDFSNPADDDLYNFYNCQFVPDQDNDGYEDILTANGGDSTLGILDSIRPTGNIMVISGKSGEQLAKAAIPVEKETYLGPVVHDFEGNGTLSVLFGSGGETLSGGLWRATLNEVMNEDLSEAIELFGNDEKGAIGSPSLADLNNDNIHDIIVHTYNGSIVAIDGNDNSILWQHDFPGQETYSTPAIGRFTNDFVPDVFTVSAVGEAPSFTGFKAMMLDGATGDILEEYELSGWNLISPIAFDYDNDGFDEALISTNDIGAFFKNQLLIYDFNDGETINLTDLVGGLNFAATPWVGDLDNDNMLDLVYTHNADSTGVGFDKGFVTKRLNLNKVVPEYIAWGAFMGNNYDCVYENPYMDSCAALSIDLTPQNSLCYGTADAGFSVSIENGTPPFLYSYGSIVLPPLNGANFSANSLAAGSYTFTVVDGEGCEQSMDFELETVGDSIALDIVVNEASSAGANDANISVVASGGVGVLAYLWNTGQTTATINNLMAGLYNVTVTDLNGCTATEEVLVNISGLSTTNEQANIQIFPNPSEGVFYVQIENILLTNNNFELKVYDSAGKMLFSQKETTTDIKIDLSKYAKGIYYVQAVGDEFSWQEKIILY